MHFSFPSPIIPRHKQEFPVSLVRVPAGFPSPADDYADGAIDLNEHLIKHPAATFFMRAEGDSMVGASINNGDMLIVDRAEEAKHGRIVIAAINGNLAVKRLYQSGRSTWELRSENPYYKPIPLNDTDCVVWGVVTHVIHQV